MLSAPTTAQAITKGTNKEWTMIEIVQRVFHEIDFQVEMFFIRKTNNQQTKNSMYKDIKDHICFIGK